MRWPEYSQKFCVFKSVGHSRPLFIYFRLFITVDNKQMFNKILPMTGVKPRTSGIESNRSTNWATTTSQICVLIGVPEGVPPNIMPIFLVVTVPR